MTFSTAMALEFDRQRVEVDFIALRRAERDDLAVAPEIIFGEAKSAGKGQLIKPRDLAQLKAVAAKLPGAIVVISVLRDHYLPAEKRLLVSFVKWGRRLNADGDPTNPVVLLTSNELMFDFDLAATWERLGGRYAKFGTYPYDYTRDMRSLADATQQIYLELPSFAEARRSQLETKMKRMKRRLQPSGEVASKPVIRDEALREPMLQTKLCDS